MAVLVAALLALLALAQHGGVALPRIAAQLRERLAAAAPVRSLPPYHTEALTLAAGAPRRWRFDALPSGAVIEGWVVAPPGARGLVLRLLGPTGAELLVRAIVGRTPFRLVTPIAGAYTLVLEDTVASGAATPLTLAVRAYKIGE